VIVKGNNCTLKILEFFVSGAGNSTDTTRDQEVGLETHQGAPNRGWDRNPNRMASTRSFGQRYGRHASALSPTVPHPAARLNRSASLDVASVSTDRRRANCSVYDVRQLDSEPSPTPVFAAPGQAHCSERSFFEQFSGPIPRSF
jgi:hypothetical protein